MAALYLSPTSAALQGGLGNNGILGGAPYIESWVDPVRGSDLTGTIGQASLPFSTLGAAIAAVSNVGPSLANPGLVHANPGLYVNELLPVTMAEFVHVQGTDARSCVLRGDMTGVPQTPFSPFMPYVNQTPANTPSEILVDFSGLTDSSFVEMFDGFTLRGGDIQVFADTAAGEIDGCVSNCVFDMLDWSLPTGTPPGTLLPGPDFGVLMVHIWNGPLEPPFDAPYPDIRLHILNNTFISKWFVNAPSNAPMETVSATSTNVAICDVNDPRPGDPDTALRGVGNPNIQNNLIRGETMALLGIDASDTQVNSLIKGSLSNAFDPNLAAGMNHRYASAVQGALPMPVINPNPKTGGSDPAFVGEMLTSYFTLPMSLGRDWRLLPDSPMVGLGVAPKAGRLQAANGTAYIETGRIPDSSFAWDGEGYGNLRIRGGVDLGFDESDTLIVCGYPNDTRDLSPGSAFPGAGTTAGVGGGFCFLNEPGIVATCTTRTPLDQSAGFLGSSSAPFGLLVPGVALPGFAAESYPLLLDAFSGAPIQFEVASLPGATLTEYYTPIAAHDWQVHELHYYPLEVRDRAEYLNVQVALLPTSDTVWVASNSQSSRD
ncbi:MAG: hypothetical protein CMJ87_11095 [Planctomycetes bacterium]|nr:hypothetical protein [Planctomycetota bacterium]